MVSKPDMNPDPMPIKGPAPTPPSDPADPTSTWNPKPLNWMGMTFDAKQTKQLWYTITQSIGQAIQKDKDRAVAASKKLRKSTDSEDDGDDS